MKVLVGCEFSGIVRDAFAKRGHDAWSCDLVVSERPGNHIVGDVAAQLQSGWDLAIFHPPCTYLCVSGARWWAERSSEQTEALKLVETLLNAPITRIALENPVGKISTVIRKPDQIIQPWQFGHAESKKTCLWLKGLPSLRPTNVLPMPTRGYWDNQTPSGQNKLSPSAGRAMARAKTYTGIAEAMADQWGKL